MLASQPREEQNASRSSVKQRVVSESGSGQPVSSSCWLRLCVPESGRRRRLHRLVAVPAVVAAMMMAVAVGVVR